MSILLKMIAGEPASDHARVFREFASGLGRVMQRRHRRSRQAEHHA